MAGIWRRPQSHLPLLRASSSARIERPFRKRVVESSTPLLWDCYRRRKFKGTTFGRVAASFDNPDWVDVTLRWDEAEPYLAGKWLSGKVKATKTLAPPAIYLQRRSGWGQSAEDEREGGG